MEIICACGKTKAIINPGGPRETDCICSDKKHHVCWTKKYKDGSIIKHKSKKTFILERAKYLAQVGFELTGKEHTIIEKE